MDLILLEKIQNLGDLGDLVKVKAGYGRNYLVPQGKAALANKENLALFEARRAELEASSQRQAWTGKRPSVRSGRCGSRDFCQCE